MTEPVSPPKPASIKLLRELRSTRGKASIGYRGPALAALYRRGLIDAQRRITDAGREVLRNAGRAAYVQSAVRGGPHAE